MQETCGFSSWVGKIPWRRKWQPTLVFLPGKSHGQRSLVGSQRVGHDCVTEPRLCDKAHKGHSSGCSERTPALQEGILGRRRAAHRELSLLARWDFGSQEKNLDSGRWPPRAPGASLARTCHLTWPICKSLQC